MLGEGGDCTESNAGENVLSFWARKDPRRGKRRARGESKSVADFSGEVAKGRCHTYSTYKEKRGHIPDPEGESFLKRRGSFFGKRT